MKQFMKLIVNIVIKIQPTDVISFALEEMGEGEVANY